MAIVLSLAAVFGLIVFAYIVELLGGQMVLGVAVPYLAFVVFLGGFIWKVVGWAKVPVPFRIPTTCGQNESLPWIKQNKLDNPSTMPGVIGRMLLEVLVFRSLFRNTKTEALDLKGPRLTYVSDKVLWLAGLAFHWSFLIIFLRHFRLFVGQVPLFVTLIENLDGFVQFTLPTFYITDAIILGAVTFLFVRRVIYPQVKYISLAADYFPLFLVLAIATTGVLMRYLFKVDVTGVKELVTGLFTFSPTVPKNVGYMFYVHVFLVSVLIAYFPFSKLMHLGGVFLSPTRNLANNNRMIRHINPWNYPVKVHTYAEYEDEFRDKMIEAGLPVDKESSNG